MMPRILFQFLLFVLAALEVNTAFAQSGGKVTVNDAATIDLRRENWGQGTVFSLQTPWLFSWNTFVYDSLNKDQYTWRQVYVPGPWSHQLDSEASNEAPLPPVGFGSYYKKILVPKHIKKTFMHLPDMASAYELWHNGEKLGGNGTIGKSKDLEQADYLPRVYELRPVNGVIELFILTSNHHYLWGGLWYAPRITDESGVFKVRELPILKAMISGTLLLATSLFCWFLYLSRRQDKKILFFSLFCLAIGIRRLCMDERVLYLLDFFEWGTLQSIENLTLYLMLPLFLNYFRHVFPETTFKKVPLIGWVSVVPFCIAALIFEVETYSGLNPYYQFVVLMFLPFILLGWGRAFKAKLKHSRMFGLSLLVFVAAVINDILNYNYIISSTNLTPLGVLAFVLFQLVSLISRYLKNFRAIEILSETLKEKNEELIQHDEFKDDFLATTSHELRMPLQGVAGLAKAVREASPDLSSDSKDKVKLIEATALRLGNLVNDILDMSSLKHGKLSIQKRPTYIEPIIENTVLSLNSLIKNKPISLEYTIEEKAGVVMADEQRLQQIFYNLIGNAIKFTHEGCIRVKVCCRDEQIQVLVTDSGIGMSTEQLQTAQRAYEMHVHQSGNELRGSGLGLSITKMLVELHGGALTIESKEGKGTTVSFTLQSSDEVPYTPLEEQPLFEHEPEPAAASGVVSDNSLTRNALIYYADDEEVNRELVSTQLLAAGYRVLTFADGQSLLDRLSNEPFNHEVPELALLDWVMPGKDGLTVCYELRKQFDASNLPIIMLTAKHQTNHVIQALNAGANDYLTKPYHEQELIARVSSQISVRRLLVTTIENANLKDEIERQEHQKKMLNSANQRLASTLDASQEKIILLSEDLDIVYANVGANSLLGNSIDASQNNEDVDLAFTNYITEESIKRLKTQVNSDRQEQKFALNLKHLASELEASVHVVDIDQERFISLILNDQLSSSDQSTQELLSSLTQELAENRQRMAKIESTLLQLNNSESPEDQARQQSAPALPTTSIAPTALDPKELVVKTLRTSLISWERYTHKSKAELAEESHCWRVYLDGATAKTRTLDKYLSVKTLPAKPRWRAVIKTANYVVDHCDLSSEDEQELNDLVQQLTEAFS